MKTYNSNNPTPIMEQAFARFPTMPPTREYFISLVRTLINAGHDDYQGFKSLQVVFGSSYEEMKEFPKDRILGVEPTIINTLVRSINSGMPWNMVILPTMPVNGNEVLQTWYKEFINAWYTMIDLVRHLERCLRDNKSPTDDSVKLIASLNNLYWRDYENDNKQDASFQLGYFVLVYTAFREKIGELIQQFDVQPLIDYDFNNDTGKEDPYKIITECINRGLDTVSKVRADKALND